MPVRRTGCRTAGSRASPRSSCRRPRRHSSHTTDVVHSPRTAQQDTSSAWPPRPLVRGPSRVPRGGPGRPRCQPVSRMNARMAADSRSGRSSAISVRLSSISSSLPRRQQTGQPAAVLAGHHQVLRRPRSTRAGFVEPRRAPLPLRAVPSCVPRGRTGGSRVLIALSVSSGRSQPSTIASGTAVWSARRSRTADVAAAVSASACERAARFRPGTFTASSDQLARQLPADSCRRPRRRRARGRASRSG